MFLHFRAERDKQAELYQLALEYQIDLVYFSLYSYIANSVKPELIHPDYLIVTSPFCLDFVDNYLWNNYLSPRIAVIAVGLASANKIRYKFGFDDVIYPKTETLECAISDIIKNVNKTNTSYIILKGNAGSQAFINYAINNNLTYNVVELYARIPFTNSIKNKEQLSTYLHQNKIRGFVISSSTQYRLLWDFMIANNNAELCRKIDLIITSNVIFDKISSHHSISLFRHSYVLDKNSPEDLIKKIVKIKQLEEYNE